MAQQSFDPKTTAVLIMDYQNQMLDGQPEERREALLNNAEKLLAAARQAGSPVIYVKVAFRPGYPEVSPRNKLFAGVREAGWLVEGTPGADIHQRVAPQPDDVVVTKRRVGAFSTTDLEAILRAKGIDTLLLFGISTSGVVLSTVRWAADMDYSIVVVADLCADQDEEVHRVLTEKVFPRQATVVGWREAVEGMEAVEGNAGVL